MVALARAAGIALDGGLVERSLGLLDGMAENFSSWLHHDLARASGSIWRPSTGMPSGSASDSAWRRRACSRSTRRSCPT
jgi:hypothetical protein